MDRRVAEGISAVTALLWALLLGHDPILVQMVAASFPADPALAVAVVEHESAFKPTSWVYERDKQGKIIGTSWGLWRLFSKYHPQFRDNLAKHIQHGAGFLLGLILRYRRSGDAAVMFALSAYNTGDPWRGIRYAVRVLAIYRRLRRAR